MLKGAAARIVAIADRGSAEIRIARPGTAPDQPIALISISHPSAAIGRCPVVDGVPVIQALVIDIAVHIPQTPAIDDPKAAHLSGGFSIKWGPSQGLDGDPSGPCAQAKI
jgi:hypothetical protein